MDWDPRYVYRHIFSDESEMESFLQNICNMDWNEAQDAGKPIQEATEELIQQFPESESLIRIYYDQWKDMLAGPIYQTVEILQALNHSGQYKLYALTNWSGELFPIARQRYEFLRIFRGIVVSGDEKLKKPDPKIYQLLLDRYQIKAEESLFIDDNLRNIQVAHNMGIKVIHYINSGQLKAELHDRFDIRL